MRAMTMAALALLAGTGATWSTAHGHSDDHMARNREQCLSFGFQERTEGFANCMLQLSLKQRDRQPPDRETLIRRYRELSTQRQGDDRYPVCSAANMDAELDITINKWVGPDCQLAPD